MGHVWDGEAGAAREEGVAWRESLQLGEEPGTDIAAFTTIHMHS